MAFVAKEAKKNELEAKVMAGVEGWKVSYLFFPFIVCLCVFTAPTRLFVCLVRLFVS